MTHAALLSLPSARLRRIVPSIAAAAAIFLGSIGPATANASSFVAGLWPEAQARGVSRAVFDEAFAGFTPSARIMELTRSQPEFAQTVAEYMARRVGPGQVSNGRAKAGEWSQTLAAIRERYGVQPEVVLAVWGMETNYGGYMGSHNAIHALATLTHGGYRADYFRGELLTALQIANAGHVAPRNMVASWAGAMGHTQFMPSSFMRYAVDFNGDGKRDIWGSIPDALASTANYLREHGWRAGETWGYEVRLPSNFDFGRAWSMGSAPLSQWQSMGVARVGDRAFPRPSDPARLYLPAGADGPAFLLLPNFDVIKRYNNSDSYALAVGHLADRILGTGGFATPWPSNEVALTRTQRREMQELLNARGFNAGSADGIIGPQTRSAIIAFQRNAGLRADGHPSGRVLQALR